MKLGFLDRLPGYNGRAGRSIKRGVRKLLGQYRNNEELDRSIAEHMLYVRKEADVQKGTVSVFNHGYSADRARQFGAEHIKRLGDSLGELERVVKESGKEASTKVRSLYNERAEATHEYGAFAAKFKEKLLKYATRIDNKVDDLVTLDETLLRDDFVVSQSTKMTLQQFYEDLSKSVTYLQEGPFVGIASEELERLQNAKRVLEEKYVSRFEIERTAKNHEVSEYDLVKSGVVDAESVAVDTNGGIVDQNRETLDALMEDGRYALNGLDNEAHINHIYEQLSGFLVYAADNPDVMPGAWDEDRKQLESMVTGIKQKLDTYRERVIPQEELGYVVQKGIEDAGAHLPMPEIKLPERITPQRASEYNGDAAQVSASSNGSNPEPSRYTRMVRGITESPVIDRAHSVMVKVVSSLFGGAKRRREERRARKTQKIMQGLNQEL